MTVADQPYRFAAIPATSVSGLEISVKKIDSSANACTPTRAGSDVIDGATTVSLTSQWAAAKIIDRATGFWDRTHANQLGGDVGGVSSANVLATVNSNVGSFTAANITVDGKGRITAAANGSGGSGGIDPATTVFVSDDFLCGSTTTAMVGCLNWYVNSAGFFGPPDTQWGLTINANRPGVIQIDTSTSINSVKLLGLSVGSIMTPASTFKERWIIDSITGTNPTTSIDLRLGLQTYPTSTLDPPVSGVYLEHLAADTNWFCVTRAASTQTRTDTTVAYSAGS